MAGIGFELRKVFERRGAVALLRAYGTAGIVSSGPMVLSIALLMGLRWVLQARGVDQPTQNLVMSMITYCLLASMLPVSLLSMVTTRYAADMLYEKKPALVLPSLYGSLAVLLAAGDALFDLFLLFSGLPFRFCVFCLLFFNELIVLWSQINYLTAIKAYRGILWVFASGVCVALLCGWLTLRFLSWDIVSAAMWSIFTGYGCMAVGYFVLLHRCFPRMEGGLFRFLAWIDRYPALVLVGLFLTVGLFGHIVAAWFGPFGVHVAGLFYSAPQYDLPAIVALFSVIVSTINFTASVEVHFYPRFRRYIGLFNDSGTLEDIEQTEAEMLHVLRNEINYLAFRQIVATVLFIIIGSPVLKSALQFSDLMLGTYRALCIGYGLYAIGNSMLLIQLYFSDYRSASWTAVAFAALSVTGSVLLQGPGGKFAGFGFLLGSTAMYFTALVLLSLFLGKLQHRMLSARPFLAAESRGCFSRLADALDGRGGDGGDLHGEPFAIGAHYEARHSRGKTGIGMEETV